MKATFAAVADSTLLWRVKLALGAAFRALVAVGVGCLAALAVAQLGYPGQETVAFTIGAILALALGGTTATLGAFGWLVLSAGVYLLTAPDGFSVAAGGFLVLTGCWLIVAHVT